MLLSSQKLILSKTSYYLNKIMHLKKNYQLPDIAASQVARYLCYFEIDGELVELHTQPESHCRIGECISNVEMQVALRGGSIQYGWLLWQCQEYFLEGEFHAVWKSPEGELVDITPQMSRAKALFIAVPNMTLPPAKLRYNRRMPLTTDPLVLRYIELATIRDIGYLAKRGQQCSTTEINYLFYPYRRKTPSFKAGISGDTC
jgi:hypothetical protein